MGKKLRSAEYLALASMTIAGMVNLGTGFPQRMRCSPSGTSAVRLAGVQWRTSVSDGGPQLNVTNFRGARIEKSQPTSARSGIIQILVQLPARDSEMLRPSSCFVLVAFLVLTGVTLAQDKASSATTTCNFDANKQLAAEYQRIVVNVKKPLFGREISSGKVWAPGGKPITLFANTPFEVGGKQLAVGAYTMFVIPTPKQWTLVISRSTDISGKYDGSMDLVRVPMDSGELAAPEPELNLAFAHVAPDQCNLRLEVESVGTYVSFNLR
jgi:Protein of unknown function (DUF2911)